MKRMEPRPNKATKHELRQGERLTRPPRLEGVVKEAKMQPVRKPKRRVARRPARRRIRGYSGRSKRIIKFT